MSADQDILSSHAAETSDPIGPGEDKRGHKGPERRCIVSREAAHKLDLIKFVLSPDGIVTPDIMEKLPGRGAYLTPNINDLNEAIKTKAFSRAFKGKAVVPDDLIDIVTNMLSRRVLGLITMANKAGRLRQGFDQVKSLAQGGELAIRIEASDGSPDGRGKIRTLSKAVGLATDGSAPPVLGCFTALELGQALGRPPVVHGAIERGRLAKTMKYDMTRLSGFRPLIPANWTDRQHEL